MKMMKNRGELLVFVREQELFFYKSEKKRKFFLLNSLPVHMLPTGPFCVVVIMYVEVNECRLST